jgi:hypothetical protein
VPEVQAVASARIRVLIFTDESSNFHPYECDGPGNCIHCDRLVSATHEPATCALCQPEGITVTVPPCHSGETAETQKTVTLA